MLNLRPLGCIPPVYFGVAVLVLVLVLVVTGVKQSQLLVLGLEFDNKANLN